MLLGPLLPSGRTRTPVLSSSRTDGGRSTTSSARCRYSHPPRPSRPASHIHNHLSAFPARACLPPVATPLTFCPACSLTGPSPISRCLPAPYAGGGQRCRRRVVDEGGDRRWQRGRRQPCHHPRLRCRHRARHRRADAARRCHFANAVSRCPTNPSPPPPANRAPPPPPRPPPPPSTPLSPTLRRIRRFSAPLPRIASCGCILACPVMSHARHGVGGVVVDCCVHLGAVLFRDPSFGIY